MGVNGAGLAAKAVSPHGREQALTGEGDVDVLDEEDPEVTGYPDTTFVGPSRGFMGGVI